MEKWLFTFGGNHHLEGKCQPVYAESYGEARKIMIETYGTTWAFQYSEKEWEGNKNDKSRQWPMEKELAPIYSKTAQ